MDDPIVQRVREMIAANVARLRADKGRSWDRSAPVAQYRPELEAIEHEARDITRRELLAWPGGLDAWSRFRNAEAMADRRTRTRRAHGAPVIQEAGPTRADRRFVKALQARQT